MRENNEQQRKEYLIKYQWYLIQCSEYSLSGFDIAMWNGTIFISQSGLIIDNKYIEGFCALNGIAVV